MYLKIGKNICCYRNKKSLNKIYFKIYIIFKSKFTMKVSWNGFTMKIHYIKRDTLTDITLSEFSF